MSDSIDDVTIVGGGDSGLLTALGLQQMNPDLDVSVIDDFEQDIPQVGKSTFLVIYRLLHESLDIDEQRFVSEVKPIWKASIYFRDWCGYPEFHYPFDNAMHFANDDTPNAAEKLYYYYDELYDSPDHRSKGEQIAAQRKSPWFFSPREGLYDNYERIAYHLNTRRFNDFLRQLCQERGISLIDDEIVGVDTSGNHIERLESESQDYITDLYVDATGFDRVLRSEQEGEFKDFNFPLDSAFNVRVDRPLSEVIPATVVESGEYGWFWQIDTFDNRDLGYVYASEFVSDEEARAEFVEHCGDPVSEEDVAKYEFDSGYYRRSWIGNCVTIGNAQGFVEPLQSTGLTINTQAGVILANLLSSHGQIASNGVRDTYNAWIRQIWDAVYDFISIHYKFAAGDNDFWERMQSIDVSRRVKLLVRVFDEHGFDTTIKPTLLDPEVEELAVFSPPDFFRLMRNMGATSTFYEENEFEVSEEVRRERDAYYQNLEEDVEGHLTTEEIYKAILDF